MLDGMRIDEPRDLFTHKLGAALKMETTVAELLGTLEDKAQSPELKELLRRHGDETHHQIANLHEAFAALGEEAKERACPAIKGIESEGQTLIRLTDESLVDAVVLSGAAETEHHEIAAYEGLLAYAHAFGHESVVGLLRDNLRQEERMLEQVNGAVQRLAGRVAAAAVA
jgi:ferritin-like metal-binding protein YciE